MEFFAAGSMQNQRMGGKYPGNLKKCFFFPVRHNSSLLITAKLL
jgi:hypothetical protein